MNKVLEGVGLVNFTASNWKPVWEVLLFCGEELDKLLLSVQTTAIKSH